MLHWLNTLTPPAATIIAAFVAVVGVLVTATVTLLLASRKVRDALAEAYDKELRTRRIDSYLKLWRLLEGLARYPGPVAPTYYQVYELSIQLRDWYFREGGLFLAETTRDAYFELQDALKAIVDKHENSSLVTLAELKGGGRRLAIRLARVADAGKEGGQDAVSRYIRGALSEKMKEDLRRYRRSLPARLLRRPPSAWLRRDLVDALNEQLTQRGLYGQVAKLVPVSSAAEPHGEALIHENRRLLQEIYREEVAAREEPPRAETVDSKRFADLLVTGSRLRSRITEDVLTRKQLRIG